MDRLQSMRVFAKVAEQGSFARAGTLLDLSNAVVTRHVADLETHLGTRLLNRTTRRLSLTETGVAYLERVKQILLDIDDAHAIASSQAKHPSGTLRVYSQVGFGQLQLSKLIPDYAQKFPDVTLDLTLSDRTVDLVEDGFDVGLFVGMQKIDASMICRKIANTEILLCASPEYVNTHKVLTVPEDLCDHVCLNYSVEQLRHSWSIKGPDGSEVNVPIINKMVSNNGEMLRQCALAGMGIVIRPSFSLSDDLLSGRLIRLLPEYHLGQVSVSMLYPSRRLLSATVRSFVDFISNHYPYPEQDPWL